MTRRHPSSPDHLVVTADDFGMARPVNEAVEIAHRDGILTAASLMVSGEDAADAVRRARRMPSLRVGLHLVLVEGRSLLSRALIPDLLDRDGRLRRDMAGLGLALAFRRDVRRQLAEEIEAQFAAFAATGLPLDHVNAHKHFHLHPVVARMVLAIGRRYGLRALRVPQEPGDILRRVERFGPAIALPTMEGIWARRLGAAAVGAGLRTPDAVLGLRWSGAMGLERLAGLLRHRPAGLVEIYTHPATADAFPGHAPGYRYREELAALCDPACREFASRAHPGGYADAPTATAVSSPPIFSGITRMT